MHPANAPSVYNHTGASKAIFAIQVHLRLYSKHIYILKNVLAKAIFAIQANLKTASSVDNPAFGSPLSDDSIL